MNRSKPNKRIAFAHSGPLVRRYGTLPLCAAVFVLAAPVSADAAKYITIDLGGSTGTHVTSINDQGVIAGFYACGNSPAVYSFVRAADGSITRFGVFPCHGDHDDGIYANSINNSGVITGTVWWDGLPPLQGIPRDYSGFVRKAGGGITLFNCPNDADTDTIGVSINDSGTIAGICSDGSGNNEDGFVRSSDGTFTTFSAEGSTVTQPVGIDGSGDVTGNYGVSTQHGFLRAADGTVTSFDPPESSETWVRGISSKGAITGYYRDSSDGRIHGFVRAADGTFTAFDPSGSVQTEPAGISSRGAITGDYYDGQAFHGFVRRPDGTITSFDPPKSIATIPVAINRKGSIAGYYGDGVSDGYGFLRTR